MPLALASAAMEDAAARKARLKALREAAAEGSAEVGAGDQQPASAEAAQEPVLKFRNYAVNDSELQHEQARLCITPA